MNSTSASLGCGPGSFEFIISFILCGFHKSDKASCAHLLIAFDLCCQKLVLNVNYIYIHIYILREREREIERYGFILKILPVPSFFCFNFLSYSFTFSGFPNFFKNMYFPQMTATLSPTPPQED
jgi:hypothetical protein